MGRRSGSKAVKAAYSSGPPAANPRHSVNSAPVHAPLGIGTWLLVLACSIIAALGLAAVWMGLGLYFHGLCGWMLVIVAMDAALVLRLAGVPAGPSRLALVAVLTLVTTALAALLITASQIGLSMGLPPQEALGRISPGLVSLFLQSQLAPLDALWLLAALAIGWWLGR